MHLQELNPLLEERQGSTEYHVQHNKASGQGDSRRSDPRIISFSCYSDSRHDIRQQALPSHGVTDENKHDIK